ncbi:hypothetical protein F441_22369 [Phytophthora nicotianae CJ01A1]|uniref:Uncharacterized protein n=1 Tax=Phytophthora nicotianae CJ01A1 TaxID=1317063 RepID=W2VPQ3_PHYNI|nr:hypothetical protein F441_22369 [Phytophthora nicotianae CJ01A1]
MKGCYLKTAGTLSSTRVNTKSNASRTSEQDVEHATGGSCASSWSTGKVTTIRHGSTKPILTVEH